MVAADATAGVFPAEVRSGRENRETQGTRWKPADGTFSHCSSLVLEGRHCRCIARRSRARWAAVSAVLADGSGNEAAGRVLGDSVTFGASVANEPTV